MFKLKPRDRLDRWKSFRHSINKISLVEAINSTNQLWASCPFIPYYLDPSDPTNWPDPWNLLIENYYCDLAKVLGIVYTLHLTDHGKYIFPEIRTYNHVENGHTYHIAYLCQGKYVLNLIEGDVVNKEHINQELKLIRCYTAADLKLEQY
jgi:hypothetical protein